MNYCGFCLIFKTVLEKKKKKKCFIWFDYQCSILEKNILTFTFFNLHIPNILYMDSVPIPEAEMKKAVNF